MTQDSATTVLLIEDSPTDARLIQELLYQSSHDSFNVLTARTLAKGLDLLSANSVDVLLLDLGLPDSHGVATFHAVHEHAPHLPIIVMTVSDDDTIGLEAVQEGAQRFLSKDVLTLGAPYAGVFTRMLRFAIAQKRTEVALRKSEEELRTLFESSPIAQIRYDAEGTPAVVNRAARDLLGIEDVSALSHLNIFTSPRVPNADKARLKAGKPARYEQTYDFDVIVRNGTFPTTQSGVRHVAFSLAPIVGERGQLEEYLAQIVDITDRKHVEDALQAAHEEVQVLNEELQSTNEELQSANDELEQRVQERTVKLQETSEELRVTNEELRQETEQRTRAEKEARAHAGQLQRLMTMVDLANNAIIIRDLDDHIAYWNKGAKRLYGWDADEAAGQTIHTFLHTEHPVPLMEIGKALFDTGGWSGELIHATKDGRRITVESHQTLQFDSGGKPSAIFEINTDVTEKKQVEAAARTQARNATLLNKIIKHGNSTTDTQDFLQYVCDLLVREYGYDAVDMRIITDKDDIAEQIAVTGFPAEFNRQFRFMSIDDPILRGVYRGESYFPARYTKTHVDLVHATHMASIGIVPLAVGEMIIGDMGVALKDYRAFSLDEQALLISIGRETGTVLARLQAEEQVRASSWYVRSLIEASLDPLVTISAEGIITDVNKATEEVTGYARDELIGSDFSDYFTEPEKAQAGYERVFIDGFVRDYPLALRHKSGSVMDVLYHATVYRNEAGEVQGVFAAARDITDRKRAEEELQRYSDRLEDLVAERTAQLAQSEEYFRTLFEASSVGQIYYGADGHPIRINHAAATFFGINDVSDIQHLTIFSSPLTTEETKARLRAGHPVRYEHVYDFKDITERGAFQTTRSDVRYVDLYMLPIFSTSGDSVEGYLAQLVDVTEQKHTEEALRNAQHLAGIGQTAAMIGHDLRNPLQGLQYIVDLQKLRFERLPSDQRTTEDWEKEQALFDRISEQIFYMDKIVGDLQDYARPITPEHEELQLSAIIEDVLEALPPADGVETVIEVSDLTFHADPHFMLRVFSNLILNAMQAMQHGGTLTISAEAFDDSVAIRVSDTGVGIPADMRDKIFSPLTTGKAKGTGLGLAVVKRIVEAHKGTITFESEEGKGTTFTVMLPLTAE